LGGLEGEVAQGVGFVFLGHCLFFWSLNFMLGRLVGLIA
jgi:hypothetical protein